MFLSRFKAMRKECSNKSSVRDKIDSVFSCSSYSFVCNFTCQCRYIQFGFYLEIKLNTDSITVTRTARASEVWSN